MFPLLDLTPELVLKVIESFDSTADLSRLCRTNSVLHRMGMPHLYELSRSFLDTSDDPLLHWASKHGHIRTVRALLDRGVPVDLDRCQASKPWNAELAPLFIRNNPRFQTSTFAGLQHLGSRRRTALICAAEHGQVEIMRLLIGAGASITAKDAPQQNALSLAVRYGHEDAVRLLVDSGVDVRSNDAEYELLRMASEAGNVGLMRILINAGASLEDGQRLLRATCRKGCCAALELLLESGVPLLSLDHLFQVAAVTGHLDMARLLAGYGAFEDDQLSRATMLGDFEAVRDLWPATAAAGDAELSLRFFDALVKSRYPNKAEVLDAILSHASSASKLVDIVTCNGKEGEFSSSIFGVGLCNVVLKDYSPHVEGREKRCAAGSSLGFVLRKRELNFKIVQVILENCRRHDLLGIVDKEEILGIMRDNHKQEYESVREIVESYWEGQ